MGHGLWESWGLADWTGLTSFVRDERLRTSNIACAPADEYHCGCKLFLRVAGYIGGYHGEAHAKAQVLGVAKPKSNEATPLQASVLS